MSTPGKSNLLEDFIQLLDTHPELTGEYTTASTEMSVEEADKALKNLKNRKLSKFRQINDIRKVRIGDTVRSITGFPMQVTGIFQDTLSDCKRGTLYLDFEDNESDVWEESLCDVEWCGSWISVLFKKMFR